MTIIETPTREQVMAEHDEILARLRDRYNTTDTSELRGISVSGEMSGEDAAAVERLLGLDYLLAGR
jgi:hypothetical protein